MRVFAALPLPTSAAAELAAAVEPLRRALPRLRWVSPAGYHVTVHFFGDLDEPAMSRLRALFREPDLRVAAIPARWGRLGQFPGRGPARVIHAELEKGAEEAHAFHDLFHRMAAPLGYAPDPRGFSPHVTLARAGQVAPAEGWQDGVRLPDGEFLIGECVLYESVLGPAGARYTALAAAGFSAPGSAEGQRS
jgi:2'-5' RNA ligase